MFQRYILAMPVTSPNTGEITFARHVTFDVDLDTSVAIVQSNDPIDNVPTNNDPIALDVARAIYAQLIDRSFVPVDESNQPYSIGRPTHA